MKYMKYGFNIKEYYKYGYARLPNDCPMYARGEFPFHQSGNCTLDYESAKTKLYLLLLKATEKFEISKENTIVLLSGGVDSNTACYFGAMGGLKKAMTVVYHCKKNKDLKYAEDVADFYGLRHIQHWISSFEADSLFRSWGKLSIMHPFNRPICESGILPLYSVYKQCSVLGYKQILTGDGGDELFLGYKYDHLARIKKDIVEHELMYHLYSKHVYIANSLGNYFGIKVVSPFLDEDVVRFAYSLPLKYKIWFNRDKRILRDCMKGHIPNPYRAKSGMENPMMDWFNLKDRREKLDFFLTQWINSRT